MEKTNTATRNEQDAQALFVQAKTDIASDMKSRGIGAILWDNRQASFHFPPEVVVDGKTWTVKGIYRIREELYLIGDKAKASVDNYYDKDTEVPPVVVTLTEAQAQQQLGEPTLDRGFTQDGTIPEWLTVADCYFEALALDNDI